MGRPPAVADRAMERAIELIRLTDDGDTLRAAQAVLLPLLGFTLEQTVQVVGRDRYWVSSEIACCAVGHRRRDTAAGDARWSRMIGKWLWSRRPLPKPADQRAVRFLFVRHCGRCSTSAPGSRLVSRRSRRS